MASRDSRYAGASPSPRRRSSTNSGYRSATGGDAHRPHRRTPSSTSHTARSPRTGSAPVGPPARDQSFQPRSARLAQRTRPPEPPRRRETHPAGSARDARYRNDPTPLPRLRHTTPPSGVRLSRSPLAGTIRRGRDRAPLIAFGGLAIVLLALCVFVLPGVLFPPQVAEPAEEEAAATRALVDEEGFVNVPLDIASLNRSTPRAAWTKGQMPYLYQTDSQWADESYAGGTVAQNACGPTCMTMLYIYFTGDRSLDPGDMAARADQGGYAPTGATEWSYMTQGAAELGLVGTAVNPNRSDIAAQLEAGNPVVCSMRPGTFTTVGHYLVLTGIDRDGTVTIHDPNSVRNSVRRWGINEVLTQADMCWAFSA